MQSAHDVCFMARGTNMRNIRFKLPTSVRMTVLVFEVDNAVWTRRLVPTSPNGIITLKTNNIEHEKFCALHLTTLNYDAFAMKTPRLLPREFVTHWARPPQRTTSHGDIPI